MPLGLAAFLAWRCARDRAFDRAHPPREGYEPDSSGWSAGRAGGRREMPRPMQAACFAVLAVWAVLEAVRLF